MQLGQGRSGLYGYDWLENLVGCDIHSTDRILPAFQTPLQVGDRVIRMARNAPCNPVALVEPQRARVLGHIKDTTLRIITAEALYTNPYNARMEISDLGATETGVVLHPSSTIFNLIMLAAGAMILAGAFFAHGALHRRAVTIPTGLLGLGVLGVGIFPGNIHPQHPLFAVTASVAGGLAVLLSARVTPQPLRAILAIMGTISLGFTLASVFLPEWGPFARLDLGGVERWMVYPVLLWLVGFGGYLVGRRPEQMPSASLPGTGWRQIPGVNVRRA